MKLTDNQRAIVSENHSLIYWYANSVRHLDLDDWYDLLAIELCLTVQKFDADKGSSLANYFKVRCDNLVAKEWAKTKLKKNAHNGHVELEDYKHHITDEVDVDFNMDIQNLFEGEFGEILKLKSKGYTQVEIADILGVTQSYISKVLSKLRKEYYDS